MFRSCACNVGNCSFRIGKSKCTYDCRISYWLFNSDDLQTFCKSFFCKLNKRYKGVEIASTSTGIGGPAAAIAVEELLRIGADTFIRVGTTGGLRKELGIGDLVISTSAVRLDGTSRTYIHEGYPAVASYEVVLALIEAADELGVKYHVGITASTDSFYVGQGRPGFKGYLPDELRGIHERLAEVNVLNFEMEASTIFTLANIYGARSGAVCAVIANRVTEEFVPEAGVEDAIKVANEAVRILSEWDELKSKEGKHYITPSLISKKLGR
jgi:uridine phosphorylase